MTASTTRARGGGAGAGARRAGRGLGGAGGYAGEHPRLGTLAVIDAPALRAAIPGSLVRRRNGYLSRAAQTLLEVLRAGAPGHAR